MLFRRASYASNRDKLGSKNSLYQSTSSLHASEQVIAKSNHHHDHYHDHHDQDDDDDDFSPPPLPLHPRPQPHQAHGMLLPEVIAFQVIIMMMMMMIIMVMLIMMILLMMVTMMMMMICSPFALCTTLPVSRCFFILLMLLEG